MTSAGSSRRICDRLPTLAHNPKLPKGRLGRLRRLAGVGLRVGADKVMGREGGAAEQASEVLGNLRGLAAKMGQMAGYIDGVVPAHQRDNYERWMKKLMDQAPASSEADVRKTIQNSLGLPLEEAFESFDLTPVASASIGQVHKARLASGEDVAVKVQHAGVKTAMDSDLSNAGLFEPTFRLFAGGKFESKRIMAEIRERFREELDYELEARRQHKMWEMHEGDPAIHVPAVFHEHSGSEVLTMEWVQGMNFDQAREADPDLRRQWCEAMWRFVYKGTLVGGMFNADPHPGNYVFHDDGRISFLDYGCVQETDAEKRRKGIATHKAACAGDDAAFRRAAVEMLDLQGGRFEERSMIYIREAFRPQFESPFRVTRDYAAGLAAKIKVVFDESRKDKHDNYVPFPPGIFFLNRLQFGFYSVLARMDVEVDYAAVEREFLP